MSRAKQEARIQAAKKEQSQRLRKILLGVGVAVASLALIFAVVLVVNRAKWTAKNLTAARDGDGNLRISRSELVEGFNYVNWGGPEELILFPVDGEIRAAFDSCEECYTRGSVHFTRSGEQMTCSVCGLVKETADFGLQEWGECRPIAIPAAARLDSGDEIVVSGEALDYAIDMFSQWDGGDLTTTFAQFGAEAGTEAETGTEETA